MTWEVAKKALDFVLYHSGESNTLSVSFYGGEPILKFDLIRKCVYYLYQNTINKKIQFFTTTNVSLLDEEKISFLEEHDFEILVSFDGPENVQNKNRKYAANGNGTYSKVYEVLKYILDFHPNYVKRITVNAVVDPEESRNNVYDYFKTDLVLKNYNVQFSLLDQSHVELSYFNDQNKIAEDKFNRLQYLFKLTGHISNPINESNILSSEFDLFSKNLQNKFPLPSEYHPKGQCVIGYKKLFVDIEGNLWPCEKVSINSKHLCIGNVYKGFNFKKIRELLNIGKMNNERCKNCWCVRFCDICLASIDCGTCLSETIKTDLCRATCRAYEIKLAEMIAIKKMSGV